MTGDAAGAAALPPREDNGTNPCPAGPNGSVAPLTRPGGEFVPPSRRVVLSLGGNLGDRWHSLQAAVAALRATRGLALTGVSGVWETAPVGVVEQPDFLNIVVLATSTLSPDELLARAQAIEVALGRVRTIPGGPRTVDVDLIQVGACVLTGRRLTLPHPRAHERAFVLVPWLEADPDAELVGHGRVAGLIAGLDVTGVRRRDELTVRLT